MIHDNSIIIQSETVLHENPVDLSYYECFPRIQGEKILSIRLYVQNII